MNLTDIIAGQPWAIEPAALQTLVEIARRSGVTPADWLQGRGASGPVARAAGIRADAPAKGRSFELIDGVAVLPIAGPIFPKANLLFDISAATSIETLDRQFRDALADAEATAILLDIDSPGGAITGIDRFAETVFAARGGKPIGAFVGGLAASAAFWIATAADEIVAEPTARLGSVGMVASLLVQEAPNRDGFREFEIVSTGAPNKRPDVRTDDGRATVVEQLDALEAIFIEKVARNRGISAETVRADFGRGGIKIGAAAVRAGMAERLGSFESTLAGLAGRATAQKQFSATGKSALERRFGGATKKEHTIMNPAIANVPDSGTAAPAVGKSASDRLAAEDLTPEQAEQVVRAQWDEDPALRAEFRGNFERCLAYHRGVAAGRIPRPLPAALRYQSFTPARATKAEREGMAADIIGTWKSDPALRASFHGNFNRYRAYRENEYTGNLRVRDAEPRASA